MTDAERRTQADIAEAYRWVFRVTEEAGALLDDVVHLLRERGLEDVAGLKTYYGASVPPDSWPCVYHLARVFREPAPKPSAGSAFAAVSLGNPRHAFAPRLVLGSLHGRGEPRGDAAKAIYTAAIDPGHYPTFTVSGEGVRTSAPTPAGRKEHPDLDEVRWFALPLAWVSSPERVTRLTDALLALRAGDPAPAQALLAEAR